MCKKKSNNLFLFLAVHHDEDYWPDPWKFIPDRFKELPAPCTFMPFNTGPRSCLGANFSLAEQCIIVAKLLRKYKIEFPQGFKLEEVTEVQIGATIKAKNLKIQLITRN